MKKLFVMLMVVSFLAVAAGLSAAEVTPTAGAPSKTGTPMVKGHHKTKKGHWKKKKAMAQATPGAVGKK